MTDNDTAENPSLAEMSAETERESDRVVAQNAEKPLITVVIPTLNEAEHIEMCLDSVFRAFSDGPAFEVVLVDSNSDDETVEIATQYPITILQITRDELTTPGAGRHVGTQVARGEQILFVDADMDIADDGVLEASRLLNERADIAGIDGCLNEATVETPENVDALRGVALYETKRLNEVGGFDPFLQGYEDIDLGFRMREAGYDLLRLPTVFATHSRPYGPSELKRRWQSGYYFGFGQAIRKFSTSPLIVAKMLLRKPDLLLFMTWLAVGVAVFVMSPILCLGWWLLTVGLFVLDSSWEGPRDAAGRWLKLGLAAVGFCRGLLIAESSPSEFPLDAVAVISEGAVLNSDGKND